MRRDEKRKNEILTHFAEHSTVRDRHLWIHEIGSNPSTLHLYTLSCRQWPLSSWLYLCSLSRFQHASDPASFRIFLVFYHLLFATEMRCENPMETKLWNQFECASTIHWKKTIFLQLVSKIQKAFNIIKPYQWKEIVSLYIDKMSQKSPSRAGYSLQQGPSTWASRVSYEGFQSLSRVPPESSMMASRSFLVGLKCVLRWPLEPFTWASRASWEDLEPPAKASRASYIGLHS